jgi:hypothetical protein
VKQSKSQANPLWAKTSVANLVRYRPSGIYFARVRVFGKLIRQSLKTDVFSVAQIRLTDLIQEQRKAAEVWRASSSGKMTFGDARKIYEANLANNQRLKPAAKVYRNGTIKDGPESHLYGFAVEPVLTTSK